MEDQYGQEEFFAQYAQMPRSRQGLSAAGEWWQMEPLFPPLGGLRVLDLGCGYGWHCLYAAQQGAAQVLGIDQSERMLAEARRRCAHPNVTYRACSILEYEYPRAGWDLVLSNLALHYVEDLDWVFRQVYGALAPEGTFLLNMEHPVFTAGVGQDWVYSPQGRPLYWPVDGYFMPGERRTRFLGCQVRKQHHTLSQILGGLLRAGFALQAVEEARPSEEALDIPGMADELRRPMMLLVKAGKGPG